MLAENISLDPDFQSQRVEFDYHQHLSIKTYLIQLQQGFGDLGGWRKLPLVLLPRPLYMFLCSLILHSSSGIMMDN